MYSLRCQKHKKNKTTDDIYNCTIFILQTISTSYIFTDYSLVCLAGYPCTETIPFPEINIIPQGHRKQKYAASQHCTCGGIKCTHIGLSDVKWSSWHTQPNPIQVCKLLKQMQLSLQVPTVDGIFPSLCLGDITMQWIDTKQGFTWQGDNQ